MADILGNKRNEATEPGDGRGYVGYRYRTTPLPSSEVINAYAARVRQEIGIVRAGHIAVDESVREVAVAPIYEDLEQANTTRPGWWF